MWVCGYEMITCNIPLSSTGDYFCDGKTGLWVSGVNKNIIQNKNNQMATVDTCLGKYFSAK